MAEETDPTEAEDVRSGTGYPDPARGDLGTPDPSTPVHRTRAIKPHRVKQQRGDDVHPHFWEQKYTQKRRRRNTFHLQRNKEPAESLNYADRRHARGRRLQAMKLQSQRQASGEEQSVGVRARGAKKQRLEPPDQASHLAPASGLGDHPGPAPVCREWCQLDGPHPRWSPL